MEQWDFLQLLKVFSMSCSIKQYQFFLSISSFWDIERLLCESEFSCFDKICHHKKPFATCLTNYTWRVKKLHVILIFAVVYCWLDKLISIAWTWVKLFTVGKAVWKACFIKVYLSVPPSYFHQSNQFCWSICTIFMLS